MFDELGGYTTMSLFWKPLECRLKPKTHKKTSRFKCSFSENNVCLIDWCGIKSCELLEVINEITLSVGKQP